MNLIHDVVYSAKHKFILFNSFMALKFIILAFKVSIKDYYYDFIYKYFESIDY